MTKVSATSHNRSSRIGFLTTWNQECGLATYARYLLANTNPSEYIVLAEETSRRKTRADENNVIRCWTRPSEITGKSGVNYEKLVSTVTTSGIEVLHINSHSGFFSFPDFANCLGKIREAGIAVISHPHTLFTTDEALRQLLTSSDGVIVHGAENRLEAIANGAKPEATFVLPHGVHCQMDLWSEDARCRTRAEFGFAKDKFLITSFGLIQPSKGIEALLEAVIALKSKNKPVQGLIIGRANLDDPNSERYLQALRELAVSHDIGENVSFISEFVEEDLLYRYLAASDLVIMNYRAQHYEASGATALALGAGAVVASSLAPAFQAFKDAVWHMTAGYPPGLTAEILYSNEELRRTLRDNARDYATRNSWPTISEKLNEIYKEVITQTRRDTVSRAVLQKERDVMSSNATSRMSARRVLMQNRGNATSNPGGDSVVMNRLAEGLRARGHQVTVDTTGSEDPKNFDIVHLFNFALPQMVRTFGERAMAANIPFVVTSLYEDVPRFHTQSHALSNCLMEYVAGRQNRAWYEANRPDLSSVPRAPKFECDWVIENAAAVFTNGRAEEDALRRDYPKMRNNVEVKLGHEVGAVEGPERFVREYGVSDFVLCVGRLETRKNQLMLLKALEDSEIPVVLAAGGFTYQPMYSECVNKFQRRGKTIVLGRISPEMLSSAYSACRVHVLPSWYELPGLVTLEAAAHSKNVVATRYGTGVDYLGSNALYCDPADPDSILNATLAGYYKPFDRATREMAISYTWEATIDATERAYESVLSSRKSSVLADAAPMFKMDGFRPAPTGLYDSTAEVTELQDLIEKGELAAKSLEFELAHRYLQDAERISPRNIRTLKARGAVFLAESNTSEAVRYFDRALTEAPQDPKVLSGRGMCEMMSHNVEQALPYFLRALDTEPTHLVAINQTVECAHRLQRYDQAISALRKFVQRKPDDLNIKFCLAGCLFRAGQLGEARISVQEILTADPTFKGAVDLLDRCTPAESSAAKISMPASPALDTFAGAPRLTVPAAPSFESAAPSMAIAASAGNPLAEKMLMEAEEAKRANDFEEVMKRSKDVQVLVGLSMMQECQAMALEAEVNVLDGKLKEAADIYKNILAIDPNYCRALCGTGALAADTGDWQRARTQFEKALEFLPEYDVALAGLAVCSMQDNDQEKAWGYFERALARNPENHRALIGILQLGYPMKRYAAIESVLRGYLDLHPVNLEMQYSLAGVLFAQQRWVECQSELSKILLFDPNHERALELMGIIGEKNQPASGASV